MRKDKFAAMLLAVCMLPLSAGCGMFPPERADSSPVDSAPATRFDRNAMKAEISDLQALWSVPGKESEIEEQITHLLRTVDEIYADYIHAEIAYYLDMQNETLETRQEQAYSDYYVAEEMAAWALSNGYKKSDYPELFAPYTDAEWTAYYNSTTLTRTAANARNDAQASNGLLTEYYDTVYDSDCSIPEANEICAQLYLDTLDSYDISDYLYGQYHRDYTPEQASAAYREIRQTLIPLRDAVLAAVDTDSLPLPDDPYAIMKQYAPRLSPRIADSADMLFSEHLYQAAEGDAYNGSYTVSLPHIPAAQMYTYLTDSIYDLATVVHEFGHFHAERDETTHVSRQTNCADIAEVQSQGLEMLFTQFYGDIFGADAKNCELEALYSILDAVISGFAIGEFEYEIMRDRENMTPADVQARFDAISEECGLIWDLADVSHLYEQTGYYISYGVSALVSLEIYARMQQDPAAALEQYEKLCEYSSLSGEYTPCAVYADCGFADPFDAAAIQDLAASLQQRISVLTD